MSCAFVALLILFPLTLRAQRGPRPPGAAASPAGPAEPSQSRPGPEASPADDHLVTSRGQITVAGQPLAYTATAGTLAMKDETGKPQASLFFVAYSKDTAATTEPATEPARGERVESTPTTAPAVNRRPITFIFNGGPGAAAVWLHIGAAGPKRVDLPDDGRPGAPPVGLVDNQQSWLTASDLVFIDPVGTGFSRPVDPARQQDFSGVRNDLQSVSAFIRLYLTRYNRWLSPKYLAGESYGTTRAAALSSYLLDSDGIELNGIVLISSVLNFGSLAPDASNDSPYPLYIPSFAAINWYHKLAPDQRTRLDNSDAPDLRADLDKVLADVREWCATHFTVDLAKGDTLSDLDRTQDIATLARYTGLSPDFIDKANLRIDLGQFRKQLLSSQKLILGRYDARITGADSDPASSRDGFDPSLPRYQAIYTSAFNDYVRRVLDFNSDLPYLTLSGRVQPWDLDAENHYLYVADELRDAIIANPHMKVLIAMGYFDLATPLQTQQSWIDHIGLPKTLAGNLIPKQYIGGHMLYHVKTSRQKLHDDIADFIKSTAP
jgi:carboxypeptidase C (cathepsin A)